MIQNEIAYRFGKRTFWVNLIEQGSGAIFLFIILIGLGIASLFNPRTLYGSFFEPFNVRPSQYIALQDFMSLATIFIFLLFVIALAYAIIFSWLSYNYHTFMLSEHALEIRSGILSRSETSIPYRQIQDVDVRRSMLQRMIGVCKLVVLTAGQEDVDEKDRNHSEGIFILIDSDLAENLHQELIKRSNIQEVREVP